MATRSWALVAAVGLKWVINREVGRYTVVTGRPILEGFGRLPGPTGWALFLILIPLLLVAVATIAGLAGSAATALVVALPGDIRLWTTGAILAATVLVIAGRYTAVERVATAIALALGTASVVAAIAVGPDFAAFGDGLRPQLSSGVDLGEVLPWLGFMLSGTAGMIWYSYWLKAKGYGAAGADASGNDRSVEDLRRLRGWLSQLTLDNSVAVVGTLVIALAFLILGAEILKPQGLVPEENKVAEVLGGLLGTLWGPIGFWFMITAVFVGFWDTVLSDQDGFGRMFANGSMALAGRLGIDLPVGAESLRRLFVGVLTTAIPIALYLAIGEPVTLLKIAGIIEAAQLPILAILVLWLGRRELPAELRPSSLTTGATMLAALFFGLFAVVYLGQLAVGQR